MLADGIFVYGTLRQQGPNHPLILKTHIDGITSAWIPGRLFHLPEDGFPAIILLDEPTIQAPGYGWVRGEFIGYPDEASLDTALCLLDELEGDLYERRIREVVLECGSRLLAWIYCFPEARLAGLQHQAIELIHGDWEAYLHKELSEDV